MTASVARVDIVFRRSLAGCGGGAARPLPGLL